MRESRINYQYMLISLSIFIVSSLFSLVSWAEMRVQDDNGNTVTLKTSAQRIISLAPHITETLFAAGAGGKIVGAVAYSDYPEAAKNIPRVGGYPSLDLEKIIALKPDLVIAWSSGNNIKQVERLSAFGLKVFMSEPRHPQDIANTIKRFGILAGTDKIATKSAEEFLQHYQSLKKHFSSKEKVKVFYQIWNTPLMTVSGQHLISNIINLCGGINVFSDLNALTPKISIEAVIASGAEVIVAGGMGKKRPEWVAQWKPWPQLPAVKKQQIYFINPDILQRVGPRILQGADQLCNILDKARN